jgi:nuclear GTP-binding protein
MCADNATTKRLLMYNSKPQRDRTGRVTSGQFMSKETAAGAGRTQADRRWFGNTRVIGQNELETFREELGRARDNPYQVVLNEKKLPTSLLTEGTAKGKRERKAHVTEVEPFEQTFGIKVRR